jgi:hypothetical protein
MTSALATVFAEGFTSEQALNYLIRRSPKYAKQISKALGLGYTPGQVLSYLTKDNPKERGATTEYEETRSRDIAKRQKINQLAGGAALAGLGATGIAALARRGGQAVVGELLGPEVASPLGLPNLQKQIPFKETLGLPSPETAGFEAQAPIPEGPIPMGFKRSPLRPEEPEIQISENVPKETKKPEIAPTIQPKENVKEYLKQLGLLDVVDDSLKRGNQPEQVAAQIGIQRSGRTTIDPELLKNIEMYAQEKQAAPQEQPSIQSTGEKLDATKEETQRPIEKGSLVATPSGFGEIESISGDNALVNEEGKIKQIKLDEVISPPLPKKDMADLFNEMNSQIEKETGEEISKMVEWAGYNPNTNSLSFIPHLGGLYIYRNIEPERAALLQKFLSQRKTTGENFIGVWTKDSKSPIGAAMSALIRQLQSERGGKGKEYEEKFDTLYSAIEPAKRAAKEKFQAKQKEISAAKREEKKKKKKKP